MSNRFSYNQEMLTSTEEYFQKIDTSGPIGEVAEEFSSIISSATGISSAACKGFFWKCVKNWQGDNEVEINAVFSDLSADERNKQMAAIMLDFEGEMTKVLKDPEEAMEFKGILADAFEEFRENYKFTHFTTPSKGSSNPSSNPASMSSTPRSSSNPSSLGSSRGSSNPSSLGSSRGSSNPSSLGSSRGSSSTSSLGSSRERSNPSSLGSTPSRSSNPSSLSSAPRSGSNPNTEGKSMEEIRREAKERAQEVLDKDKKNTHRR